MENRLQKIYDSINQVTEYHYHGGRLWLPVTEGGLRQRIMAQTLWPRGTRMSVQLARDLAKAVVDNAPAVVPALDDRHTIGGQQ